MRVVHVNYDAAKTGGASIAMLRLHAAMRRQGIESFIICRVRPDVPYSAKHIVNVFRGLAIWVGKVLMKIVSGSCHSTGLFSTGIANAVNELQPSAVILHWIQSDTISINEIRKIKAPVFWFHHDLWPIRGITAYNWFPIPRHLNWLDSIAKSNKRRIAKLMGHALIPVCASQWVAEKIRSSSMYAVAPMVIPLCIDGIFKSGRRDSHRRFRILNGARGGFDTGIKGGDRLLGALEFLTEGERALMEIYVFGSDGEDIVCNGVAVHYLGRLEGEALAQAYRDADVFAFPSREETYGQTKTESIACGTPVIAFDETACAEGIYHMKNGWIAPPDDIQSYARGIQWFFKQWMNGSPIRVTGSDAEHLNREIVRLWCDSVRRYGD